MTSEPIRVLVVDDSAFARKVIREVLEGDARFEVVDTARDGLDALEKIARLEPDVVTLDLVMPNLDGIGVLKAFATFSIPKPPRVVVVSMADDDSDLAISALQCGAVELVHKPTALATDRLFELQDDLRNKVVAAAASAAKKYDAPLASPLRIPATGTAVRRIVVIGTSTGGPQALSTLLAALPVDFPVPIAIALHMPVGYTDAFARRLDQLCALEVLEAYEGVELLPGRAVVARAGMHLKLQGGRRPIGTLDMLPLNKPHRPSVDVLLSSAADAFGSGCVGVVLTGMGDDGLLGAQALRAERSVMLTEAASSCVVYGMPRSIEIAGLSDVVAPLEEMAAAILREVYR